MVDKFASDEEELYYTSKNYLKLQYSNKAYIDNTEKEKNENEREIDTLKNEYTKLKEEVENLRKAVLFLCYFRHYTHLQELALLKQL
jgi:cell division protein FtsB